MSGHTPGPLTVKRVEVRRPFEECAATIHGPDGEEIGCAWRLVEGDNTSALPGVENAILWAAAPELADALEALLVDVRGFQVIGWIPIVWAPGEPGSGRQEAGSFIAAEQARAALAKAGRLP